MDTDSFWFSFGPLLVVNVYVFVALGVFFFIGKRRPKTAEVENRHSSVILNKWIREFWMWLTQPIYRFFIYFKVRPNTISFLGTFMALLSGLAFVYNHIGLAGWIMVIGASLDFFDGQVARATGQSSRAGSFFDASMDRISEGVTLSGIAYMYRHETIPFFIVMVVYLGSMLTSYTKAKGETMGIDYSGGMMQRPERLAYLGAGAILTPMIALFLWPLISPSREAGFTLFGLEKLLYLLPVVFVAIFCSVAAYHRIVNIMKLLKKSESEGRV